MSTRLETTPWLTKNFAVGAFDTAGLLRRQAAGGQPDGSAAASRFGGRETFGGRRSRRPYHRRMLLAVDIGNSNISTGLFRNGSLVATRRATSHARATADELEH